VLFVRLCGETRYSHNGNKTRRMRFACWIAKVADIHSEYVILLVFCVTTIVTRTRPSVSFIRTLPVLLKPLQNCILKQVITTTTTTTTTTATTFSVALRPNAGHGLLILFLRFLDHTQRRTTVGRTPLDE